MNNLRITLVQTQLAWEDVNKNIHRLNNLLIGVDDTDIIVLPEMFTTGFTTNAAPLAKDSYEKGMTFLRKIAMLKNVAICGSLICEENGRYYNRYVWMSPSGEPTFYDKRHLFTMTKEDQYFHRGDKEVIIEYKNWKIRPLICYDLRFPVWSRNKKDNPYDLLIYVANWPEKRIMQWNKLLQARAIENVSYVAGVNRVGKDGNDFLYTGQTMMVTYKGEAEIFEDMKEEFRTFTINKEELMEFRTQFPVLNDADDFSIL